jgi:DNA-binding CsgD family transcriptional regulator
MGPATSLPIDAISAYLLDLHRSCRELSPRALEERSFERLEAVVAFDSGLLAAGTLQRSVPHAHDTYLHRQPAALMESWQQIKHLDVVATAAMSEPGRAHRFVVADAFAELPAALAHCRAFSLEHVLCTAAVAERAAQYFALSIYRHDTERPFTEADRKTLEILVPHIIEALRQARLEQLRRATRTTRLQSQAAAIVSRAGVVIEAEPGFIELLAEAYPAWTGPWLPRPLASLAEAQTHERRAVGRLILRADPRDERVLVHARRATVVDALTEREGEVARLFASGESTKELAGRLGISPNTVRVHLGRIYEKLGVVNKAELASMLADHD